MKESDTGVGREFDDMQREARGRSERYEYFEGLTYVHLVRRLSVRNGGKVEREKYSEW